MDSTSILIQTIILVILLIGSGFFSMSETSLMSLSKIRIRHMQEEGVKGAKLVSNLIEDSNKFAITVRHELVITKDQNKANFSVKINKDAENDIAIVKELKDPADIFKFS